jgi:hypothetical protein
MAERTLVTVIRKWSSPEIRMHINNDEIGLRMTMDDFVAALADEAAEHLASRLLELLGSPAFIMTRAQLAKRVTDALEDAGAREIFAAAAERIVKAAKAETAKIA